MHRTDQEEVCHLKRRCTYFHLFSCIHPKSVLDGVDTDGKIGFMMLYKWLFKETFL